MTVYVIRHAQAEHNVSNTANDATSAVSHLTPNGIQQAEQIAREFNSIPFDQIITSELERTIATADIINHGRSIPTSRDSRLNDIKTGMQGRPFKEFVLFIQASKDVMNARYADGESIHDEWNRAVDFLEDLKKQSYQTVLIVTHGSVGGAIYGHVHKLPDDQTLLIDMKNCAYFSFEL